MTTSTILSDNGATSGTSGLKTSGGNDGTLILQTTTSGGTATTALTIDTSQNTTLAGNATAKSFIPNNSTVPTNGLYLPATNAVGISTNSTNRIYIDSSGNVGIGTSSPADRLQVSGASSSNTQIRVTSTSNAAEISSIEFFNNTVSRGRVGGANDFDGLTLDSSTTESAAVIRFRTGGGTLTERARITSGGLFLVGTTSAVGSTFSTIQYAGNTYNGLALNQSDNSNGGRFMLFASQGTQCGVIDRVGTTSAVVYTTTSDARLKKNIEDAPSAIDYINSVKVRSYIWKDCDHSIKYGVIAQELYEVEPDAVVKGDDAEVPEKFWSVDTAQLVPAIIKVIQELKAINDAQATRIETLEAQNAAFEARLAALEAK